MTQPLGTEFIKIRPDASTFRAELQTQVAAALTSVQGQLAAAQTQMKNVVASSKTSAGGVVLPASVRSVTAQAAAATAAQTTATRNLGNASQATRQQLLALSNVQRQTAATTAAVKRGVQDAETSLGRYSRGMFAATAASTGFFRAVTFASGAFLVGAAVGASIGAAVQEFTQMTQVGATTVALIKSTGGAANTSADQIDELAKSTLALTGVDDELVKSGANVLLTFRNIRNEAGQGNDVFNRATKAAADISAVFRTDLRGSALQLGKALQDPIRGVTALRRSGITLTQSQRDLITQLVKSGALLSAQKIILGEVERQVGGAAAAIGQTLPGQLRIMREEALNTLGTYVEQLTKSKTASELAADGASGMAQAFGAVRSVVQGIGPSLIGLAQGLSSATKAIGGVGTLLGVAAGYKAVTIAARLATTAQGLYTAASAGAARAAVAQAASQALVTTEMTAAAEAETAAAAAAQKSLTTMTALSAVFAVGAAASGQYTIAVIAGGFALIGMATKAIAAVKALQEAGTAVTAMRVATAALGGPVGLAAIGVGVLAFGMFKLWQNLRNVPGSLNATKAALDGLNEAIDTNLQLRAAVGTAREQVGIARFDVRAAQSAVTKAQDALSSTRAAPGSLRYKFLEEQVAEAEQKLADTQDNLRLSLHNLDAAREQSSASQKNLTSTIEDDTRKLLANVEAQVRADRQRTAGRGAPAPGTLLAPGSAAALAKTTEKFQQLTAEATGARRVVDDVILKILTGLNRLPTTTEVTIAVKLAAQGLTPDAILRQLKLPTSNIPVPAGFGSDEVNANLREEFSRLSGILKQQRQKFQLIHNEAVARREVLRTARLEVQAAQDAVTAAKEGRDAAIEGLASAQRALGDAQQNLADTIQRSNEAIAEAIKSGREAVNAAVQDAKGNLLELNRAVADAISLYMSKTGEASAGMNARLRFLRQQIIRGAGGPETLKAAQEVNFKMRSNTPDVDPEKVKRNFDDLTDSFVRGKINLQTYDKRFNALTQSINIPKFKALFGSNAANEFLDTLRASRQQAVAISQGPQRIGGAIAQKLVVPLQAVRDATKAVAAARVQAARDIAASKRDLGDAVKAVGKAERDVVRANRQLAAAERRLRQAQHKEVTANTRAVAKNTEETKQLRIVIAARDKIDAKKPKAKPTGAATDAALPYLGRH